MKKQLLLLSLIGCTSVLALPSFRSEEVLMADGEPIGTCSDLRSSGALSPAAYDWDGDGDLDLLVGTFWRTASVMYYENIGSSTEPVLTKRGFLKADGQTIDIDKW